MSKLKEIEERYSIGYTITRYGNREIMHNQMTADIKELIDIVKNSSTCKNTEL